MGLSLDRDLRIAGYGPARGEVTVGDIDLALESIRRPDFSPGTDRGQERLREALAKHPDHPENLHYWWFKEDWLTNRALYGPRRHPLFAGVQDGIEDLASLNAPCQLIYDRARKGRVSDPILPCHPQSTGHEGDLRPPAKMPDLTPCPIRPMDGRWIAGFSKFGDVSPYDIFRDWNDDAHQLFPRHPEKLRVLGDDRASKEPWVQKRRETGVLDGREAVELLDVTPQRGVSIILNREIDAQAAAWRLCASFSGLEFQDRRQRTALLAFTEITAAAALILAVDIERMLRRAAELKTSPAVEVHFQAPAALDDQIVRRFIEPTREYLTSGAVRMTPQDWRGEAPVILGA